MNRSRPEIKPSAQLSSAEQAVRVRGVSQIMISVAGVVSPDFVGPDMTALELKDAEMVADYQDLSDLTIDEWGVKQNAGRRAQAMGLFTARVNDEYERELEYYLFKPAQLRRPRFEKHIGHLLVGLNELKQPVQYKEYGDFGRVFSRLVALEQELTGQSNQSDT